ncbi:MAG TPA: hypothetical protein VGJ05_01120 [Fimbriiglobus sp.]|jgi:hypothetical protein
MRACVFVVGLVVLGCGESGPVVKTAKPVEQRNEGVPVFPLADPPAVSDPNAAAVAAKIVAAHTANDPALLEKLKTVHVVRDGIMNQRPGESTGDLPVRIEFTAAWPDRCKYSFNPSAGVGFSLYQADGQADRFPDTPPLTAADITAFHRDAFVEWLLLLVPLGDPNVTFGPGPEMVIDGKKYPGLRLWKKDAPQVILSYDPATFRILKWTYNSLSTSGIDAQIELIPSKFDSKNGLLYPETLTVRRAGISMITFTKSVVEFPKSFDKSTFKVPKK